MPDQDAHPEPATRSAGPPEPPETSLESGGQGRRVVREAGWRQYAALLPAAAVARFWTGSLRIEIDAESRELLRQTPGGAVFVLWHNRLFVIAEAFRRFRQEPGRRMYGLVSASRDGAWLAAFFRLVGIHSVRGSSSWRARPALREMRAHLGAGHDLGITPDGPRGPCYSVQPGAVGIARLAKRPVLLVGVSFAGAWRLSSWDRFYLPHPFSRLTLRVRPLGEEGAPTDLEEGLRGINPDPG
ncbi:MAG: DUF374 domain-containing protein [Opitutales bacterium]